MIKIGSVLILLLLSESVFAAWHYDNLVGFEVYVDGGLSVSVETTHECGSTVLAVLTPESEHTNRIISVLLAHQATAKEVRFLIQSCSGTTAIFDRVRTY